MKKTLLIDGGPRRNMNTAALCDAFTSGEGSFLICEDDMGKELSEMALEELWELFRRLPSRLDVKHMDLLTPNGVRDMGV